MAISSYTNFLGGVIIRDLPILQTHPGKVFWVCNRTTNLPEGAIGPSDGNKGTYLQPLSTLKYAVSLCKAGRGDIIVLGPGHAESISSATALTLNVADIAIVGLGTGTSRPTLTLDTANTATINVTAANISIKNVLIVGNFLSIATVFTLTTAKNFNLENVDIKDTSSILGFLSVVTTSSTDNAADGLRLFQCSFVGLSTSATSPVLLVATTDRVEVDSCYISMAVNNNKSAVVSVTNGKIATNIAIRNNRVIRLNTDTASGALLFHTNGSTNTGMVNDNYSQHADTAAELIVTASSGLSLMQNYSSGVVGNSGYIIATIDS